MADFEQPAHFAFDAESIAEIDRIVAKYPPGRQASAVIPALYVAQRQMKRQTDSAWVPVKAMDAVGERLGMPPIRVYEVATFYFMFNTAPIGKYHLQLCTTTPCWLRGSDAIVAACIAHDNRVIADHAGERIKHRRRVLVGPVLFADLDGAPLRRGKSDEAVSAEQGSVNLVAELAIVLFVARHR